MTVFTPSLRLSEPVPGDPAVKNAWGTILNENMTLVEAAILGTASVSIAGLTTYSLTTANGAPDQARPFIQSYTGALTGDCTVTIPNEPKIGWAQNSTTGGFNVILTAGAGTTATIPPDSKFYWYKADGATNVVLLGAVVVPPPTIPPTGIQFGDMKYSALGIEGNGWRLCNGQTRPQTDPFWVYMVAQGLTASWKPGFTGTSTYNTPNAQDVVLVGLDAMGGATSPGLLTNAVAGFDPTIALNIGGSQYAQADTLTATSTAASAVTDPGHTHTDPIAWGSTGIPGHSVGSGNGTSQGTTTNAAGTGITVSTTVATTVTSSLTGASQNIQPSMMASILMYTGA
jgi:hypothetical protein